LNRWCSGAVKGVGPLPTWGGGPRCWVPSVGKDYNWCTHHCLRNRADAHQSLTDHEVSSIRQHVIQVFRPGCLSCTTYIKFSGLWIINMTTH
jgi:hypothetical protein